MTFEEKLDNILEGHWVPYTGSRKNKSPFKDSRSLPGYDEVDPASGDVNKTVRKKPKKSKGFQKSYQLPS